MLKFQPEGKTWEEILSTIEAEDKMGFLYFTLQGCGPCKALEEKVFHNQDAIEYIESKFISFWIESNNSAGNALFKKYEVRGTPTVILVDKTGEVMNKIGGYSGTAEQYLKRLRSNADPDSSISALRTVMENDPYNTDAAKKYAEKLYQSSKTEEAIEIYEKLKEQVSDLDIYTILSYCYEMNDTQKAIKTLEEGLSLNVFGDESDIIYLRLGNLHNDISLPIELRNYKKALQYYLKIPEKAEEFSTFDRSENDKRIIRFHFERAQFRIPFVYIKSGQEGKGQELLQERFPNAFKKKDFRILGGLFNSCVRHDTYFREAETWAEKVNKLPECNDYGVLLYSARLFQKTGKYRKAVEMQEKLLALMREKEWDTEQAKLFLSVMYLQAGDQEKAWTIFNDFLEKAGNDFVKYLDLAGVCIRNDVNLITALKWIEKAIKLSKTEDARESEGARGLDLFPGMIYDTYAEALFKTGQIQKAIEIETQAVEMSLDENSRRRLSVNLEKYKAALK